MLYDAVRNSHNIKVYGTHFTVSMYHINVHNSILVPTPFVQITTLDNETNIFDNDTLGNNTMNGLTIGDPLTLNCTATTVRGISSSVDIIWTTGGRVVRRVNNIMPVVGNDSVIIYTDTFEISSLSAIDNGRVYQCTVVINASPQVFSSDRFTLTFPGEHLCTYIDTYTLYMLDYYHISMIIVKKT